MNESILFRGRSPLTLAAVALILVVGPIMLLARHTGLHGDLTVADRGVLDVLHRAVLPHRGLAVVLEIGSVILHPHTLRGVSLVIAVVLVRRGDRLGGVWTAALMLLTGPVSMISKAVVGRPRPVFADPVAVTDGLSFPSGHALGSAAFALCLVALAGTGRRRSGRVLVRVSAVGVLLLTAADRLLLGVHYPSDVVAGWITAVALACATSAGVLFAARWISPGRPVTRRDVHTGPGISEPAAHS